MSASISTNVEWQVSMPMVLLTLMRIVAYSMQYTEPVRDSSWTSVDQYEGSRNRLLCLHSKGNLLLIVISLHLSLCTHSCFEHVFHWSFCDVIVSFTWAHFLSLARSKLRLCSANHRPGYWSNLPCKRPSTVWAYSEQKTENGPRT